MNQSTFNALFKYSCLDYKMFKNTNNILEIDDSIDLETSIDWIHQKNVFVNKKMTLYQLSIRNTNFPVFRLKSIIRDYFKYFNKLSVVITHNDMRLTTNSINGHIILTIFYKNKLIAYSKNAKLI